MRVEFVAKSADVISTFAPKNVLTLFLEHDEHLLLLMRPHKENQLGTWDIPGVKVKSSETESHTQMLLKKLRKKTQIQLSPNQIQYKGHHYARIGNKDYKTHLY